MIILAFWLIPLAFSDTVEELRREFRETEQANFANFSLANLSAFAEKYDPLFTADPEAREVFTGRKNLPSPLC